MEQACGDSVFGTTNRIDGRGAASTIASASAASFFRRLTRQFSAQNYAYIPSGGMNPKHSLCKVEGGDANFLHGCSLL